MVKVVSVAAKPEIVSLGDLMRTPAQVQAQVNGPTTIQTASEAVNNIDKWISLADRGVSLFGQVDRILQRVQTLKGPGPVPAQAQPGQPGQPAQYDRVPAGATRINADHDDPPQVSPAPPSLPPRPDPEIPNPAPAPGINVLQIAEALKMIDKMQPGVSCAQLAESIQHNPAGVQKLVNVYLGVSQ
jgi:hypothetical protein